MESPNTSRKIQCSVSVQVNEAMRGVGTRPSFGVGVKDLFLRLRESLNRDGTTSECRSYTPPVVGNGGHPEISLSVHPEDQGVGWSQTMTFICSFPVSLGGR